MYACYQASYASNIENDPADDRRQIFLTGQTAIHESLSALAIISDLLEKHPEVIIAALSYPDGPKEEHDRLAKGYKSVLPPREVVNVIAPALRKIISAYKLGQANSDTNFSDMAADCIIGPFLYFHRKENRGHSSGPSKDYRRIVEDGLIFHLAYLFRYFSGGDKDPFCSARLKGDGEIVISGAMIKKGDPHVDAVAHLANVVFDKTLPKNAISGRNVVDRLKGLLAPSVNEKISSRSDRRAQPFADIEFFGWPRIT